MSSSPSQPHNTTPKLLVIDNYDSFTYNLVQMFTRFHLDIIVKRSDKITIPQATALSPDYILISPGPKDPAHAGVSMEIIRTFHKICPILGVCLGMQCLNEVFGGTTQRAPLPVHGKTDRIMHNNTDIFKGMPSPLAVARYHSLIIAPANPDVITTAWNHEKIIMGITLKGYPVFGVQFHPESFLTEKGEIMINNFLKTGVPVHHRQP
ncbi:anthranilate synthase component 2 [Desulfocicer vacuolatum DSM 3385]|uniref:Anthranilate synthase component 2 n=1 Tax=Desulfocicer vacuolatum DSM 3385 TaxID=1121400 RepID=A0A1W2DNM7_9BACT|nr:aminodeoxychorismate/anthranilate synthase component II [Desulfocicer vacuolatum]SMC99029.1 anthranilate synthase component 2 [Desulfocicer vacuolatum DSM 3385]